MLNSGNKLDAFLASYEQKKNTARRSPYPTVCVEVRATPPPPQDFQVSQESPAFQQQQPAASSSSSSDVKKLEALFGKTASFEHPTSAAASSSSSSSSSTEEEDSMFEALSGVVGIQQLTFTTPLSRVQDWVAESDPLFDAETCTFSHTDAEYVDEAYEQVFSTIAMNNNSKSATTANRQYLVYSSFMSSSATSFEKFASQAESLVDVLPSLKGKDVPSGTH